MSVGAGRARESQPNLQSNASMSVGAGRARESQPNPDRGDPVGIAAVR